MPHSTEHHLEHAEHAQHAAHDPFDKRVAVTMAIVAAVLAAVSLMSHRKHNETLSLQIQSNKKKTEAANRWAQYQARSIRRNQFEAFLDMLPVTAQPDKAAEAKKVAGRMQAKVDEYRMPAEKDDPKDPQGLAGLMALAKALDDEAVKLEKDSEHVHHQGDRFDLAELFVELALVVCSVALLSKQRLFWYAGMAIGGVGVVLAGTAFFVH